MDTPTFNADGEPTDETLETIVNWPDPGNKGWSGLIEFCKEAWNTRYGSFNQSTHGKGFLVAFVTGGWSDNEAILNAMYENRLFYLSCWHSSQRGGVVRFII